MTIAQELNELAVAHGGTAQAGGISGALDALNDALSGKDEPKSQTIEGAIAGLGQHIGGGVSTEYNITCFVNGEPAQSVIYPAKASTDNDGKWEQDGNTPIDTAQAGQVLLIPSEYGVEIIAYFSDPMPEYPQEIPYSSLVAKDNDAGVFVMPAHDIGIMAYQVTPK